MLVSIDKNGIAHDGFRPESDEIVHRYDDEKTASQWLVGDEVVYEMDASLTSLRDAIERSVFVANDAYRVYLGCLPIFAEETGYRPSGMVSSHAFQWICDRASCEALNRYLYVQDVWWLSDSLNAMHAIAAEALAGFFRELSRVEVAFDHDGLFEAMGMTSIPALKELQAFVLSLHACLDIATKLLHALSHIPDRFDRVPSRIGGNKQFRKVQGSKAASSQEGTLFESCWETTYLGGLRDEVVHNRALDAAGAVFVARDNGRVAERFVLLPDADERGVICGWKNRRRFYSLELKANEIAPHLFMRISKRISKSLDLAVRTISFDNALELSLEDTRRAIESIRTAYLQFVEGHLC